MKFSERAVAAGRTRAVVKPSTMWILTLTLLVSVSLSAPAVACPDCEAGRQARLAVWNDGFAADLAITLFPFALIAALCAWIEREGDDLFARTPERWRRRAHAKR